MIELTDKAINKIKEIAAEEQLQENHLRVAVKGGGCGGFVYDLSFEDGDPLEMDEVIEQDDITLVIDCLSYQYLDGTEIDYHDGLFGGGFKFNNPNITAMCGCGNSFSI